MVVVGANSGPRWRSIYIRGDTGNDSESHNQSMGKASVVAESRDQITFMLHFLFFRFRQRDILLELAFAMGAIQTFLSSVMYVAAQDIPKNGIQR